MPHFSSSAFARGKKASPEGAAIKAANLLIDQAKAKNSGGVVSDPAVYDHAIKMLDNFSYDTGVLTRQAQLQAEKNQLVGRLNDQGLKTDAMKQAITEGMYQIGKNNIANPTGVISKTAALYSMYADALNTEITERINNGQSFDSMVPLKKDIEDKAQNYAALSRAAVSGAKGSEDKSIDPSQFGFLMKTNPQTGKVVSFTLADLNSDSNKGYFKTDSHYGSVPIYINAYRDPADNNNLTAKIGNATYKGTVDTTNPDDKPNGGLNQVVLKMEGGHSNFINRLKVNLSHPFTSDVKREQMVKDLEANSLNGHLTPDLFDPSINLPPNSVAKDSSGNYYFLNNDGKLFQGSADTVSQYTGMPKDKLDSDSYFLTSKDIDTLKSKQSPDQRANSVLPSLQTPGANQGQNAAPQTNPAPPNSGNNSPTSSKQSSETPYAIKTKTGKENQADLTKKISTGQANPTPVEMAGQPNPIA